MTTTSGSGRITASLVSYKHSSEALASLIDSLQNDPEVAAWVVVDNSATLDVEAARQLKEYVEGRGGKYIGSRNDGFGAGHNKGFQALKSVGAEFHLFVNPDIGFDPQTLRSLVDVMDANPAVGRVMPKVVYPDGRLQRLNKLLPTPFDIFVRRFLPVAVLRMLGLLPGRYELPDSYERVFRNVPFLSGCFIFLRQSVFEKAGGFDERYFMYLEDTDLSRTAHRLADSLYRPEISISHGHVRGSHHDLRLTWVALLSSVAYFNKWGWFFDRERRELNRTALKSLQIEKTS